MRVLAAAALLTLCAALPSACAAQENAATKKVAITKAVVAKAVVKETKVPMPAKPRAVWVWNAGHIAQVVNEKAARDAFFAQLQSAGIGTLFLNPNDLLNREPLPATDANHLDAKKLAAFIASAHANGLKVEALQGDPEHARTANHSDPINRLKRVLQFNANAAPDGRFDGMQFDIEPYSLPDFAAGGEKRAALMTQFLELADTMRVLAAQEKTPFALGFAMPFWMDNAEQDVTFHGAKKPVTFHLIDLLKTLPNSYIALMAYRDSAPQTIDVSSQEIEYARSHAPNVKVWVGQETNKLDGEPPVVTYFDNGRQAFQKALTDLETHYRDDKNVAGIAIHDWAGLQTLPSRP